MKPIDWPPEEIQKIAGSSGKPLEVTCAMAFKKAEWIARLGSYFLDPHKGLARELDVLIEKTLGTGTRREFRIRVFLSCKGFRPGCAPLAYSVSREVIRSYDYRLPTRNAQSPGQETTDFERAAALQLLKETRLTSSARPLVAYDILQEREEQGDGSKKKGGKKGGTDMFNPLQGDSEIFEGVDSAVKACLYWRDYDAMLNDSAVSLYVPVLVLASPFWDVSIDGGKVGVPGVKQRGYQTCSYPLPGAHSTALTTLIWAAEELPDLVDALDGLFSWFCGKD